ncbi:dihydroflavonol 4-reductase-like1 isoform X2 [Carex rostrata]
MGARPGLALDSLIPSPSPPTSAKESLSLSGSRIAFTTPENYGNRLSRILQLRGAIPLPVPTISVGPTASTLSSLRSFLLPSCSQLGGKGALDSFSALGFTSRTGISSFSLALSQTSLPCPPLTYSGDPFTVAALGTDAEVLHQGDPSLLTLLCPDNPSRVQVLVPEIATPAGLVKSLGNGSGRKVLCPVPAVIGLNEPDVIPDFMAILESSGWVAVRVPAYETKWVGPQCADALVELDGKLDAIVFTSTAEVEGLLKGLDAVEWNWEKVKQRWPRMIVAAHGPVTAKGIESFGLTVDVVGEKFSSFVGVLDALSSRFQDQC